MTVKRSSPIESSAAKAFQLQSFCRSVAEIQWLLVALVLLYLVLAGHEARDSWPVMAGIGAYFLLTVGTNYLTLVEVNRQLLIAGHVALMLLFVTWLIWSTGSVGGPLGSLYLLPIITSALALGKAATVVTVVASVACYLGVVAGLQGHGLGNSETLPTTGAHVFTFLLVGYLTTMLADAIYAANERLQVVPRLEQEVSDATKRLQHAIEQSADAFVEIDSQGRITGWNAQAETMFGWRRDEVLGRPVQEVIVPEKYRRAYEQELAQFLQTGESRAIDRRIEGELLTRDGEVIPVELLIHDIKSGGKYYFGTFIHDISERQQQRAQLSQMAHVDSVTGLANRYAFEQRVRAIWERAEPERDVALVIIDLDGFKAVNDENGHAAGDRLLKQVGKRLKENVRDRDLVARLGGDEFAVLMEQVKRSPEQLETIAHKLIAALGQPYKIERQEVTVTASLGLALAGKARDADDLKKSADKAMYRAKHAGKNQFQVAEKHSTDIAQHARV